MAATESCTLFLAVRVPSLANLHEHWRVQAKRIKGQRSYIYHVLCADLGRRCPFQIPLTITLTRVSPRSLDQGNLEACFKAYQDGIADYLYGAYGRGQDRQPGLLWVYAQRKPKAPGVAGLEICFCPAE